MQWKKSPPELISLFEELVPPDPVVEKRKMFGYPCCFVNGNMMMGLHQDNLILRMGEADRQEFLTHQGTSRFEPMKGHIMKEYVAVSDSMKNSPQILMNWVQRSLDYVRALPVKVKKSRKQ